MLTRSYRWGRILGSALLLALVGLITAPTAAQADLLPHTNCLGGGDLVLNFNPPVVLLPQPAHYSREGTSGPTLPTCIGETTSTVTIHNVNGSGNLGCLASSDVDGNLVLHWGDGSNSDIKLASFVANISSASKVIVLGGTVNSGKFDADSMLITVTSTSDSLSCPTGLATYAGRVTLSFTHP